MLPYFIPEPGQTPDIRAAENLCTDVAKFTTLALLLIHHGVITEKEAKVLDKLIPALQERAQANLFECSTYKAAS